MASKSDSVRLLVAIALVASAPLNFGGCNADDPFEAAFLPGLQSGIVAILSGVVDGIFNALLAEDDEEGLTARQSSSRPRRANPPPISRVVPLWPA
jgi:hypothetical protein